MTIRTLIWCPSQEGHLRYAHHLAEAAHRADEHGSSGIGLMTTCPVPPLYDGVDYEITCANGPVRPRETFPTVLHWFLNRVGFHLRQESTLVRWLAAHPDCRLVHLQEIHFLSGPLVLLLARGWLRRKVVLTVHNLQPHHRRRFTPVGFHRFWTSLILRQADALIVHGQSLRQALLAQHPVAAERVHVIAHGVWQPDERAADEDPVAPTDHASAPVLLVYGTIRPNKGLHHLLDAYASAPSHWHLVVAGSPVGEETYFNEQVLPRVERLRAAGRSIETNFDYVPEARVGALFERATLLMLPYTDFAAQSGVLFDAIAYRVPVVCTPAGALGDTVRTAGIGIVAASAQPDDLLGAIHAALALPRTALRMALDRAAEENSWRRTGEQTLALYRDLLA